MARGNGGIPAPHRGAPCDLPPHRRGCRGPRRLRRAARRRPSRGACLWRDQRWAPLLRVGHHRYGAAAPGSRLAGYRQPRGLGAGGGGARPLPAGRGKQHAGARALRSLRPQDRALPLPLSPATRGGRLAAFELWDKEDFAARADPLKIARGVVDLAVDRDGGLLLEVLAEPGIELVERLDDVAKALRLDVEFALAGGVAPAEPARQDDLRDPHCRFSLRSCVSARSRSRRSNLDPT